ncbi:MAG: FHA domain-containing protein [Myxococcales bacterium]|nr:FHA domain-containing protein [Myxococcales bacterium]
MICTSGPSAGEEFPLIGDEVVVGRAADNQVSIPDTSVSRKHVLLRKLASGWAASDMGSGNGTLVNGEAIAEETLLKNGDSITIGDSELTFVEGEHTTDRRNLPVRRPGTDLPARRPADLPVRRTSAARARLTRSQQAVDPSTAAKRKKLLLIGGASAAVVVLSLLCIKLYQWHGEGQRLQVEGAAQAKRAQLGVIFQEGKNLVREGKWAEARVKFEEMHAINPNYPTLQDYLDRANKEIPNQQHLTQASTFLADSKLGPAKQELEKVTEDTTQYQQLRSLRHRLDEKLSARLTEARTLLEAGGAKDLERMRQLEAMTDDMLVAFPEHRDTSELSKQAKANIAELTKPPPPPVKVVPKPWLDVEARFRDGDITGAHALANDCAAKRIPQCRKLPSQIASFQEKYRQLESLPPKVLSDLLELDETLGGGEHSKMAKNIGTRLAGYYYKSASAAKAAGEWGRAMELAKKTLKVDPGHPGAQAIAAEMRGKAKDLYLQAYSLKETNPDEAMKLFKDVIAMTPRDDENNQKARRWIEQIEKQ